LCSLIIITNHSCDADDVYGYNDDDDDDDDDNNNNKKNKKLLKNSERSLK